MVISIIGSGALGKLYGGLLSLSGHDVHFLVRSEYVHLKAQQFYELNFKETEEKINIEKLNLYQDPAHLPKADLVIITLKTTDNQSLKSLLAQTVKPSTTILIIQNGIGNEAYIEKICPTQTIISAISTVAATRQEKGKVDIFFLGELRLAPYKRNPQTPIIDFDQLWPSKPAPTIKHYDDYQTMRWEKLIWNITFCSLSIIYDKPSDILASTTPYVHTTQQIMSEIQDIAASIGVVITNEYIQKTIAVTRKVVDYYPSMYWDYAQGRPIEKEYIIDNALLVAKNHNVATPCLSLIRDRLEQLIKDR